MDIFDEKFNFTRKRFIIALAAAVLMLFVIRLFEFQVVKGAYYREQTMRQTVRTMSVDAARGEIFDRNGVPLAVNRIGYAIIFDKPFFPADRQVEERSRIILSLISLLTETGEDWIDTLPITQGEGPYEFSEGKDSEIAALKKDLRLNTYATADNCMDALIAKCKLSFLPKGQARQVAGVMYEMNLRGFSLTVQYTFARDVSLETVAKVKENSMNLPGVDIKLEPFREYPDGDLAPNIIGVLGPIYREEYAELKEKGYLLSDTIGKSGIEKAMEEFLRGKNGIRQIVQNPQGIITEVTEKEEAKPGNSLYLTIDANIQRVAMESFEANIEKLKGTKSGKDATVGGLAVVNVKTGEVLALVSYPTYDLATYYDNYSALVADPLNPLYDKSVKGTYPPGSTFKMLTAMAALENGVIDKSSSVTCKQYYEFYAKSGYRPKCTGYHGPENVIDALSHSCNIFFYDVGRRTGIDTLNEYALKFGFAQATGLEIPESKGKLASRAEREKKGGVWNPGETILAAIGQSDNMFSPIQIANYVATIANGGTRYQAHLVREVREFSTGNVVKAPYSNIVEQTGISAETINIVKEGMLTAAKSGTASSTFKNYKINVGAKTGSAQVTDGTANGVFVAFAPYENPEIAVAIVVEHSGSGGVLGPIARDIFDEYFGFNEPKESSEASGSKNTQSGDAQSEVAD